MPTRTSPDANRSATGGVPPQESPAATVGWSPPIDGHGLFKSLMLRMPRTVRRSFDHEQLLALRQAAEEMAWGEHPLDIRLALPSPAGRFYLLLIGGRERRGPHRRMAPVRVGNHASMFTFLALLLGLGLLVTFAIAGVLGP
jgi:hypothetical protein